MELLRDIGVAGFLFFLIKGLLWLTLIALVYFGLIDKQKARKLREKFSLRKRMRKEELTQTYLESVLLSKNKGTQRKERKKIEEQGLT
jgi:hypothetical protein